MADRGAGVDRLSVALTGSGGAGVLTAGAMLLETAGQAGWYGLSTRAVGPQIRGGEAAALLQLSTRPVTASDAELNVLLAVDWQNFERFQSEIQLTANSLVIADPEAGDAPGAVAQSDARIAELPLHALAKEIAGGRINMVALGAVCGLIGLPVAECLEVAERMIADKGAKAVQATAKAIRAGHEAVPGLGPAPRLAAPQEKSTRKGGGRWLISGNEAAGLGAIRGGVRFVAAYPITPATDMLEWLAPALAKVGGVLVQAEDELASINMIIGASYGGTPALTATSGPGLALMTESIGLAITTEVPIVVVDVMRGGPSTGLPTKSEQADLNIAVHGFHGDAPHVVVAPMTVADCLFTTQWAVYLAEALQTSAIVLSDQHLGQARAVIDAPADVAFIGQRLVAKKPAAGYQRYAATASGISPMALPGTTGGQYTADGLEHNERGTPSTRSDDRITQMEKRRAKVEDFDYGDHWAEIEGSGELAVITWGSSTGPVREALGRARRDGVEARLVALRLISPARPEHMARALDGVTKVLVVEQSQSGQLYHYLKAHYDPGAEMRGLRRPGPLPILPAEVLEHITEWG
ncbi:MAG: 2-oxoacid:acceptor oxidoreductase subunit alpha [Rhodospirillales bacterium]|jgi:2-oxoglutarate ferredoxin oxidoreductase subunit alpha|nr:2-oxoacid:acceptor oxidoreductase subunit alpha [Rhodospirillales bacterium]